ncbi:MAG: putative lipid II flippase FtsW [Erysipelotrichales bacterium]|nr:putative lipid II flippase FtsW [Erysipelotrichales bacterium]
MRRKIILFISIFLTIFGILMITSSSSVWAEYKFNNPFKFTVHQSLFACVGLILMFIVSNIDYKLYYKYANKILIAAIILLILVLMPGVGVMRNGSRSWFGIGSFGIQPSEIAKISLIIFVAKYLSKNEKNMDKIVTYALPIIGVIMFVFFLILLEPDFGSGAIIVLSLIVLIFTSNIKVSFFVKLGIVGLAGIVGLILVAPYRMARIVAYLNPWSDPLGSGFQIIQSLYAIGPGGLFGLGLGNSIQKHFYLPEPQTDFIFAIISEELGFIGILILTACYILLFYNVIKLSLCTKDLFGKYLSFGLIIELVLQTLLNLLVVVGLIPVTGVTLPFLSYGGSSLLTCLIMVGIILNVEKNNR